MRRRAKIVDTKQRTLSGGHLEPEPRLSKPKTIGTARTNITIPPHEHEWVYDTTYRVRNDFKDIAIRSYRCEICGEHEQVRE